MEGQILVPFPAGNAQTQGTRRFFSAQNVAQYILDGTIQKAQTCVFYHMTYDSIVMT
jgi:hypothetical protein